MELWSGRVALVTGASSGIGGAIASRLASHGLKVVVCARNFDRLEELSKSCESCSGSIIPVRCDLSDETEISAMFQKIQSDFGGVDICINNAGMLKNAPLLTSTTEKWRQMLDVNVLALCICTRESVKRMKERGVDDGFIINICSMAGHRVMPISSTHFYMATKHAVRALTEGVSNELRAMKSNIRVMQISPGIVETEIFERGLGARASAGIMKSVSALKPEDVADCVIFGLSAPPHVQVTDILLRPTNQEK